MSRFTLSRRELLTGAAAFTASALLPRFAYAADPVTSDRLIFGGTWEGLVGIPGGIPTNRTQSGATINPYTGSASTINSAIGNAAAGTFVQLAAGTFNLSSSISMNKDNVTLRGAVDASGKPATIINWSADSLSIEFWKGNGWNISDSTGFTNIGISSGATRGSTTLTLASTPSSLVVGQLLVINAPSNPPTIDGGSGGSGGWSAWFGSRPWTQFVRCTAKSGNTITIAPAVNADYLSGAIQVSYKAQSESLTMAGLENLSLMRNSGNSANDRRSVNMQGNDSCWIKNCASFNLGTDDAHFFVLATFRTEIRHCEIHLNASNSSTSYCISIIHSSNALIEDNYFHDVPNVMPMFGLNGSAFAFNYINDLPYIQTNWLSQIVFFHGSHSHYNLFEGNWCPAHYNNADTGCHSRNNLFFRERMRGWDAAGPKSSNTQPFTTENHHDNLVIAGCVMGEVGYHTAYNGSAQGANAIFALDSVSNGTAKRLSNYNTVNGGIPAAEALAQSDSLVTSYLHSAKPAWFGPLPWPWCTPSNFLQSNTPTNLPAGYRATNGVDPVAGAPAPTAPTNVRIVG